MADNFEGHEPRYCGEHRTVGPHRAWCWQCTEWCYPEQLCARCELARRDAARAAVPVLRGEDPADVRKIENLPGL